MTALTSQQASVKPSAIAIDGPVAAGKSAVGAAVARKLGYRLIDTGVMYRAVTCAALDSGLEPHDEAGLGALAHSIDLRFEPGPVNAPESVRVVVDGQDLTERLRTNEIGVNVSVVSRVPAVREAMVVLQRRLAGDGSVVMVGRDIGTVVLRNAPLKVYLDASPAERVRRRHAELVAAGKASDRDAVERELALRDKTDSSRDVSPLRPADDAVVIHTDSLSLEEVVDRILELAQCS